MQPETKEFTQAELIACAAREVAMRRSCYPRWDKVTSIDLLSPARRKEIGMMEAIVAVLGEEKPAPLADAVLSELANKLPMLRNLATPGDWQARTDDAGDIIGIEVRELLWDGPITPEMVEAGRDQEVVGEEVTIVANMAWDEAGNELERIDANINYVLALRKLGEKLPGLLARLRSAEVHSATLRLQAEAKQQQVALFERYLWQPGAAGMSVDEAIEARNIAGMDFEERPAPDTEAAGLLAAFDALHAHYRTLLAATLTVKGGQPNA